MRISLSTLLPLIGIYFCILLQIAIAVPDYDSLNDWSIYRGDRKGLQYSNLGQINTQNVSKLEPAWTYHTGDAKPRGSSMYSNAIIVEGRLFFVSPGLKAIALDAATGEQLWKFDPSKVPGAPKASSGRNRGVAHWGSGDDQRIFHFVKNRVYAINALTGDLIRSFGKGGYIDLRENLRIPASEASVEMTAPGIVFENLLIVGGRVPEGYRSTPGDIRAYDTVTGEFRWIFHTLPKPGEFGHDTWEWQAGQAYGGANPWGGFTLDSERGWVFCATGSPSYDFYGANRKGINLFGNCVLALNARTGERVWHYQTVRHDLWDMDNPSAPILVTIDHDGVSQDAVVQMTKMGLIFVLDRDTGEPLFPVDEVPVPASDVPGEYAWPTQPIPRLPPSLCRSSITEADLDDSTPERHAQALAAFRKIRNAPLYAPPSLKESLVIPGFLGGIQWHGASYDAQANTLYVNSHDAPSVFQLVPEKDSNTKKSTPIQLGRKLYSENCVSCHGVQREGVLPAFPPVLDVKMSDKEMDALFQSGRGLMPPFPQYTAKERRALIAYMRSEESDTLNEAGETVRYVGGGYKRFGDDQGAPWIKPPWGKLSAVDLGTGQITWEAPLGEYPHLVEQGIRNTGSMNFGGVVATAGGVIFVAATADLKMRAFDKNNGDLLWEYPLPAGGHATPSIYSINGRQFVVIACGGGGKVGTPTGDTIMAFALPDEVVDVSDRAEPDIGGDWIELFDGETLNGWVQRNGSHKYTVEDRAIIGRTVSDSPNSFLCTEREFGDFELELEVMVDDLTNSGIQIRSSTRPETVGKKNSQQKGRVWGPQVEIRRNLGPNSPTTGLLYAEATGTGWMSSKEKVVSGHDYFDPEAWNKLRIVAKGPRIQTYVNGHLVEDLVDPDIYKQFPRGFIGLQIHGIRNQRSFTMGWRNIQIREI